MAGTSSPSNASTLPSSLAPLCCHPKQEVKIKIKNQPHLALQTFSVASHHWAEPPPRLQPGQMSKSPTLPDPAAQAQISSPEPFSLALGCSRAGQGRISHSAGGGRGASPAIPVGRTDPLSWATLSSPHPALCQKFFQRIKDPSKSLLGVPVRPLRQPPVLPQGSSYTDWGELSRLVL